MKELLRTALAYLGFDLVHVSTDPVLRLFIKTYNELRLNPLDHERWIHTVPRLASLCHLKETLQSEKIDVLLDVGANVGQFALDARRTGFSGDIISFEPLAAHQQRLRQLSSKDGSWRILPYALGATAAEMRLNVFRDDTFSSLHTINDSAKAKFGHLVELDHTEQVQVCTIDGLAENLDLNSGKRIFLKTDTQGHDIEVLKGAYNTLRNVKGILTEATVSSLYDGVGSFDQIKEFLLSQKFVHGGMFPITYSPGVLALLELDCYFTRLYFE